MLEEIPMNGAKHLYIHVLQIKHAMVEKIDHHQSCTHYGKKFIFFL